jgi:hypothetical protein
MFDKLGWHTAESIALTLDERAADSGYYWFTPGPVVGVVPDIATGQKKAPPRTLFYGRLYLTEKTERFPLGLVIAVYDHVEILGKGRFPVCVVSIDNPVQELKDGKAQAMGNVHAYPVRSWSP